jgi:MFS family permease
VNRAAETTAPAVTAPGAPGHAEPAGATAAAARAGMPGRQAAEVTAPAVQQRPLRRNLQFQVLWIGQSAATLGVSVADIAYPLAILAMTSSPGRAGLFAAVQAIGALAGGLPAGSLADRYDNRLIVIVTEAIRAAVTGAVVLALIAGWLTLPLLLGAAVLLGVGGSVAGAARLLLVRSVVPDGQLTTALTQDEVRQNGAALAGPALGGALYAVRALAHALPFAFTAGSFLIAALTALVIRTRRSPAQAAGPGGDGQAAGAGEQAAASPAAGSSDMLAGLRTLWSQPVLRAAMLLIMFVNTSAAGLDLVVIVILRHQAARPSAIGLALGLGAAGGLAGAPLVKVLHRLRPGVLLLSVCGLLVPVFALLALPFGPWWVAALIFIALLGTPALRVLIDILVIRQAPADQRGRVIAALMTLMGLGIPAGLAGCGLLLQYIPAQAAMLILAGLLAAGVAYCATKRELRRAVWPR